MILTKKQTEILRFVLVGATCFTLSMLTLFVGTDIFGLHYLVSFLLAITLANITGWILNRNLTFKTKDNPPIKELAKYFSANLSSMLISMLLTFFFVSIANFHYLAASALIAILMMTFNYLIHKNWSFRLPN